MPSHSQRQPTEKHTGQALAEVGIKGRRTSSMRFTCLSFRMNSTMLPFSIHSEIIANRCSVTVTPSSGKMLGCRRCFQATPSLQKLCNPFIHTGVAVQVLNGVSGCDRKALSRSCRSWLHHGDREGGRPTGRARENQGMAWLTAGFQSAGDHCRVTRR
jgi:hypothetical protein